MGRKRRQPNAVEGLIAAPINGAITFFQYLIYGPIAFLLFAGICVWAWPVIKAIMWIVLGLGTVGIFAAIVKALLRTGEVVPERKIIFRDVYDPNKIGE